MSDELPALEGAARGTWQAAGVRLLERLAEVVARRVAAPESRVEAIAALVRHLNRLLPHVERAELAVEEWVPRLNGRALFITDELVDPVDRLGRWLAPLGAAGLWFKGEPTAAEVERLVEVAERVHAHAGPTPELRVVEALLARAEVSQVGLLPLKALAPLTQAPESVPVWQYCRVAAAMEGALFPGELPYRDVRSLAEGLAAAAQVDIGLLVSLPFMGVSDSVGRRAADVAVLCLAAGRALDESPARLVDWALAGLLHEAGRAWPAENEVWSAGARVCALAVRQLADAPDRDVGLARRVVAAVEHGALLVREPFIDVTGPRLTSQVVAAARVFLKGRRSGLSAIEVTSRLAGRGIPGVDPAVTALLASVIGTYPVGSLLELDDGELAVVIDQHWARSVPGGLIRPQGTHAELLADRGDQPLPPGTVIILGTDTQGDGRRWAVRRTLKTEAGRHAVAAALVRRGALTAARLGGLA